MIPSSTVKLRVAPWVNGPLVPVMATEAVPVAALLEAVSVSALVPVVDAGLKLAVTPAGKPLAVSATVFEKPFILLMVTVLTAVAPRATVTEAGETDRLKSDIAGIVTVRLTVVLWVNAPLVPVTVRLDAPVVAVVLAVNVSVPVPVVEAGLKLAVTPAGRPVTLKATLAANPLILFTVIVLRPLAPRATLNVDGAADRLKSATAVAVTVKPMLAV